MGRAAGTRQVVHELPVDNWPECGCTFTPEQYKWVGQWPGAWKKQGWRTENRQSEEKPVGCPCGNRHKVSKTYVNDHKRASNPEEGWDDLTLDVSQPPSLASPLLDPWS